MESELTICQWNGCNVSASKHIVLGARVFDVAAGPQAAGTSHTREHLDLCQKHIDLAAAQHLDTVTYDLGECPIHGPDARS